MTAEGCYCSVSAARLLPLLPLLPNPPDGAAKQQTRCEHRHRSSCEGGVASALRKRVMGDAVDEQEYVSAFQVWRRST